MRLKQPRCKFFCLFLYVFEFLLRATEDGAWGKGDEEDTEWVCNCAPRYSLVCLFVLSPRTGRPSSFPAVVAEDVSFFFHTFLLVCL